ncbi:MAG: DUF1800 domain-containing protein [Pyrinomonadaceae bacterium]
MTIYKGTSHLLFQRLRRGLALLSILALLATAPGAGFTAQKKQTAMARLTEDQRIIHVLNRLGFGARPGDMERVKAMGLETYINQQLNPEKISDEVAETKVKNLGTLSMTTAQLYEKFPQPGMLLRELQRRGELPAELAEAQKNRTKGASQGAPQIPESAMPSEGMKENPAVAKSGDAGRPNLSLPNTNPQDNQEYRRALREYYVQNGLQQPQRIIAELQASRILRAVYSERQLNEVMVDFWTNHFNIFAGKGADRWLLISYDRDTIRPNAMGNFGELLLATAQSPAMLFYLDNFQSVSPNAQSTRRAAERPRAQRDSFFENLMRGRRIDQAVNRNPNLRQQPGIDMPRKPANAPQRAKRGINENYARELMELHSLGVDGGYTQKDVQEVARCFTGWTIFAPRGGGAAAAALLGNAARENAGKFFFNARMHDDGEKIVLGHKIPAGGGFKDGLMVLVILAHHPSTAKYISQKLVRYFVADTPPPALVDRVAAVFTKSDGNIRETLKAIFFSPEFSSPEAYRAKVKRPFELAISAIRTLGADTNGGPQLHQWIARMGEPLYGFQTPNGYSDTAESWVNTGGLLERLNFGLSLASNRIPGTRLDLRRFLGDTASAQALAKGQIMDRFLNVIVAGDMSPRTKETLLKEMDANVTVAKPKPAPQLEQGSATEMSVRLQVREGARGEANLSDPVTKIVGLILGSPEFQRQ